MLISSSFLSNADWHSLQVSDPADLATKILPDNLRRTEQVPPQRAEPANPQQKMAQESSQTERVSNARRDVQADAKRAATQREETARAERSAEARRRHARRARLKATDGAQHADRSSTDQNKDTPAAEAKETFLAILGDVLPQDAAASGGLNANPNGAHAGGPAAADSFSALAHLALGENRPGPGNIIANDNTAVAGVQTPVAGSAGVAEKAAEAGTAGASNNPGAQKQAELSATFDAAYAVKTQVVASGPGTVQAQKQAEVAFAARITERTATGAALSLTDVQATIAASRFDAANAGGQSNEGGHGAPQSGESNQAAQPDPYGQAAQEQAASAPGAAPADGHLANGAQATAVRAAGSQPGMQQGATPMFESHAATASASPTSATPVTATSSSAAPATGNSGPAKGAGDARVPQFLEPQNETSARAGETVRDISLKLTNQDQASVQVRLSERAGELHVSVRTPDAGLTRNLREGLSDLVGRLEQSGYRAETWRPADSASTAQDHGRENPSQQHSSQQQNGGGPETDSRQQQNPRDQQHPGAQTPEWVGELESSLQRSNRSWQP